MNLLSCSVGVGFYHHRMADICRDFVLSG